MVATRFLPLVLRAVVAIVVATPATGKFLDYRGQVDFFASLGLPAPELTVVLVGAVEVAALVMLVLGFAGRVAAAALAVVMVVAIATAGVNPLNVVVLLGSLGIVALGTGPYSLWQPEDDVVGTAG
ncbi:DoxX family protein [Halomicrococcus gelatinilyticus]|uniref:DoxX family protein n=1 Tax=Halomicrococcus gelatinilyticus TaxID=1702103 RepID=UPI002E118DFA